MIQHRPAAPSAQRQRRRPNDAPGAVIAVGLAGLTTACATAGASSIATALFVGGAAFGAYWLGRTRGPVTIEFTLWLWLLVPLVRRLVDHATSYHDPSLVLAAAPFASLASVHRLRHLRWRGLQHVVRPLLVVGTVMSISYAIGAMRFGLRPASGTLLVWLVPVLFGLQVIVVCGDFAELRDIVDRFFVWGTLVVGIYGVVQFYAAPAWDVFWMTHVSMTSIGDPEPFKIRVFSTLNSPGIASMFLAAAVLYLTSVRHRVKVVAQIAGVVSLGLTIGRASWLACVLGAVLILMIGKSRARTNVLLAIAIVAVGALQMTGPIQTVIADRVDETREGRQDDSLVARVELHRQIVPLLLDDVAGQGLGATGVGARVSSSSPEFVSLDSGLLDFTYSLGLPGGLLALGALVVGAIELARAAHRSNVDIGVVAAGMSVIVQMIAGNTMTGFGGIVFFTLWATALQGVLSARAARPVPVVVRS